MRLYDLTAEGSCLWLSQ